MCFDLAALVSPVDVSPPNLRGTKPYKFLGFGDLHGPKPYKFIGFGDLHGHILLLLCLTNPPPHPAPPRREFGGGSPPQNGRAEGREPTRIKREVWETAAPRGPFKGPLSALFEGPERATFKARKKRA